MRVNALALALTYLWKRPLPDVLKQYVWIPSACRTAGIGKAMTIPGSTIDGKRIHVVPGGGHWGGGMFISARDLARMGLLGLNKGEWGGKRILSEQWVTMAQHAHGPQSRLWLYELVSQHRSENVSGRARG